MIVSNVQIYGIDDSIKAAKYAKAVDISKLNSKLTEGIEMCLCAPAGSGHDNALNGFVVQFDLTFTLKAWTELQRYHFMDFVTSQSTMHRILRFDIDEQCNGYVDPRIKEVLKELISQYVEGDKESRLRILYNIPTGFRLTARMTTNYRQLKTIYAQRRHHALPDWQEFCDWIETLPLSYTITGKR